MQALQIPKLSEQHRICGVCDLGFRETKLLAKLLLYKR